MYNQGIVAAIPQAETPAPAEPPAPPPPPPPRDYAKFTATFLSSGQFALSVDKLTLSVSSSPGFSGTATALAYAKNSGKWYFEVTFPAGSGDKTYSGLGVAQKSYGGGGYAFHDNLPNGGGGAGWRVGGTKAVVSSNAVAGAAVMPALVLTGKTTGVAVDLDSATPTMYLYDTTTCAAISTATLASGISWAPTAVLSYQENNGDSFTANFGATPLKCAPAGFQTGWFN